jgi:segregation and condensation protein A
MGGDFGSHFGAKDRVTFQRRLDFDGTALPEPEIGVDEALVLDLDGFEGPLHVLLELARSQKVDLLKISITRLADQYLAFVHAARKKYFSLAADYLVMASWLAYLKSRLLLPKPERKSGDEPPPEDLAAALAFRLKKLEAMRHAVEALNERPILGRDVFARGDPEARLILPSSKLKNTLFDLMAAYIVQRRQEVARTYDPNRRVEAYALEDARAHLRDVLPRLRHWTSLREITPHAVNEGGPNDQSYRASTFSASLELAKEGRLELQQLAIFDTLYVRKTAPKPGEAHDA